MLWQPIETAPKDGRDVILALVNTRGHSESPALAYWNDEDRSTDHYQSGWYESTFSDCTYRVKFTPTHWMPIPEPPEITQ